MTEVASPESPSPDRPMPPVLSESRGRDDRNWGLFAHLSALSGYIGVPAGSVLGPLIIWLIKRDSSPYIAEHAKEALNFQLSIILYLLISLMLIVVFVGIPLLIVIPILDLVFTIVAAVKASEGMIYRYPFTIRFIS